MSVPELRAATLAGVLARLKARPVEVAGMVSIGAGRGRDMRFFSDAWPEAVTLLIDMDRQFEASYRELQAADPRIRYEICGAAGKDCAGRQLKTSPFGGSVIADAETRLEGLIETPFKRLDTLVREHRVPGPYFLKFDTHGAELDVLSGAPQVLTQTSLIMMECYNFHFTFMDGKNLTFEQMVAHMDSIGFRVIDLCDPLFRPTDQALWQLHMLFARRDHPSFRDNSFQGRRPAQPFG